MLCIMILFGPILRSKTLASMITGLTIRLMQNIPKKSRTLMEKSFLIIPLLFLKTVHIYENGAEIQRVTLNYKQLRFMGRSLLTEVNFTELVNNQSRSYTMSYNDYVDDYSPTQTKAVDNSDIITDGPVIPIL